MDQGQTTLETYEIDARETSYIAKADLESLLRRTFGSKHEFEVRKNDQRLRSFWSYKAPRELSRVELGLLAQEYSLGPFPIPERLLRKILTRYAVAPLFLDVLRGVSNETRISEESYGNAFYRASRKSQTNIEISYQLKYADHARYDPNFPWQIRQTEVFHRMTVDKGHPQNFWLVFQPVINSRFEKSLQEKVGDEDKWRSLETNPIRQHVMLISAYVDNWREYLASIGKEYQYHRRRIAAVQFTRDEDFNSKLNFKSMQELRALGETVESVPVMLDATSKLIKSLHGMNQELRTQGLVDEEEFDSTAGALGSISIRLGGYGDSAAALLGRTRGIIKLVTDALNLRNQNNAAANQKIAKEINETMLNLTMESVDDSYVVRVVTLATLIYLPGSFVASLFGMNFFDFDDGMSSLRIAANSWIYLVVTVPLTLLTALAWWFAANGQKKKRDNKRLGGSDKA
ncbi:hypothetical protein GTA08_BOTSDO11761 [Botryosphaeria dothidea]|uniref:CorA-like transporter domain-containing protein n=1 Tax=Botryosphaeria dothidea TaxID=55169 RepID=A0A8H4J3W7_9PEZI|nr:hypothetical protein GTA08_BOTSDO11761 [Botryosphaeria dothidea]